MNPMNDKLYRNWRANEITHEIAREARIHSALQTRHADPVNPTLSVRFTIRLWLTKMTATAKGKVRYFSASVSRPARS